jgi:Tfp pilus assembly PilM family ATPase
MFVLTDGAPDDVTECKRAVKAVEAAGVTVIGVGINSSAVKNCFRDWVQITDPRDLTAVIINSIAGSLARDKRLVGRNKAVDLSAVVAA